MSEKRRKLVKQATVPIAKASSVLLACHVRPDADALGSLLALSLGLERLGKRALAVSPDGVPEIFRFLPHWERIRTEAPPPEEVATSWDVAIGLDADGSDRLGPAEAAVLAARTVIDLDHHTGTDRYGHIQVVDPTAAATGELVYALLAELGVPLTPDIACCLLAALLTDTGSFRFTNVTALTLRIAADLVEAGAHPAPIYEAVYGARAFEASRLLGRLLSSLDRTEDGRIVWGCLSAADFRETGARPDQTEGFAEQLRMVRGAEVAIFFREERSGEVRVSLRSRSRVNVALIAEAFDGGGHPAAAGCTLPGPMAEAVRRVVAVARRFVEEELGAAGRAAGSPPVCPGSRQP